MGAQRAYEVGFINEVVEPGQHMPRALELAAQIARNASLVVRALKSLALQTMPRGPVEMSYANGLMMQGIRESADYVEGISAMNEKRQAAFKGT